MGETPECQGLVNPELFKPTASKHQQEEECRGLVRWVLSSDLSVRMLAWARSTGWWHRGPDTRVGTLGTSNLSPSAPPTWPLPTWPHPPSRASACKDPTSTCSSFFLDFSQEAEAPPVILVDACHLTDEG